MKINWTANRRTVLVTIACFAAGGLGFPIMQDLLEEADGTPAKSGTRGLVPLIYASRYDISVFGLEHFNPFDGHKYSKIQRHLLSKGIRTPGDFIKPFRLSGEQLLKIHTDEYLESLKDSGVLARIFEVAAAGLVPSFILDWRILQPMRLASGGTMLACRLALQNGLAINIGGGYHHADHNHGGGFCVYADVPLALTVLHEEGKIGNALIIDTDAHQGNGNANILRDSGWARVVDFFDESIYPFPKVLEDMSVPLPARTRGDQYLAALEKTVPIAIAKFKPDLIVYNAGSDVLASDPLSSLLVSPDELCTRDAFVVSQARERGIPLAMVLSGGYSKESASSHAKSIELILTRYDRRNA